MVQQIDNRALCIHTISSQVYRSKNLGQAHLAAWLPWAVMYWTYTSTDVTAIGAALNQQP